MIYEAYVQNNTIPGKKVVRLLVINVAVLVFVLLSQMTGELWQFIGIAATLVVGVLINRQVKKISRPIEQKREEIVQQFGSQKVAAFGRRYMGFSFPTKYGVAGLSLLYTAMIGWSLFIFYGDILAESVYVIRALVIHGALALMTIYYLLRVDYSDVIIFENDIIFGGTTVVALKTIPKIQCFECHSGNYIIELNSPERFDRIEVNSQAYNEISVAIGARGSI